MLHIHRAERADGLIADLAAVLADALPDPFMPEVVAVPTRGMERWVSQRLAARLGTTARAGAQDGICANVLFPSPRRLLADVLASASGVAPEADPWLPERSVWALLETVEECLDQPWLAPLAAHLGAGGERPDPLRRARRLSAVRHLAALLDGYAVHRPEMVCRWAAEPEPAGDWQQRLWRRLRERIGQPGPAERLLPACRRLEREPALAELPPRLALFGLTRLIRSDLHVLRALSLRRDVHLLLLHPSPALWERLEAAGLAPGSGAVRRSQDPTRELPQHPLLASWGRDAREMQVVLAAEPAARQHHRPLELQGQTLLQRLQTDVIQDRLPPGTPVAGSADLRPALAAEDRSVQIHACHGRARQVEVLREAILHELAEDPALEPRDVIVMCPDIEAFAPLITATFGGGELGEPEPPGVPPPDGAHPADGAPVSPPAAELRVRLADRSLRQTNPLLAVVAELLALADARISASQVLDLADRQPVRRRFGFDDDELAQLEEWVAQTGIRWGLDGAHREPYGLQGLQAGTWRAGLDRLLLGVTMTEAGDRLFAGRLPLDDVGPGAIDVAGRFAELVARLASAVERLGQPQPLEDWARAISDAADGLTVAAPRQAWQRAELQRLLDDLVAEAQARALPDLALAEVRSLLEERLAGRPTRANFRTGHLTICTLYPMRSVPHRVVCLLGLDDGAFPRQSTRDGDNLLLAQPQVGERDPRSEDRQLLLDALMAAQQRLLITYTAADERTNARRPPAVPVGELLDAVDATVACGAHGARERIVTRHPLQPFDPRNFVPGQLLPGRSWSFDPVTLAGARALGTASAAAPPAFLPAPLAPVAEPVLALEDVIRFVQHPVRAFLRRRLRLTGSGAEDQDPGDSLSLELGPLQEWQVGQRLLEARLAGVPDRAACLAEIARGTLPPGVLGEPVIRRLYPLVDRIVAGALQRSGGDSPPEPLDVQLPLEDGRRLSGTIADAHGDVLLSTTFARVRARQRLSAWVQLVAATAAYPEHPWRAATIGRGRGPEEVLMVEIEPLGADPAERRATAWQQLQTLLALYQRGLCEPLPLYASTSAAYAAAAGAGAGPGEEALSAARAEWSSDWRFRREDREPEHVLVLGGVSPLETVLQEAPDTDELPGAPPGESSRFGVLARRLWDPLLAREHLRELG